MCNPHYLKNIALNAFESHKAELRGDDKLRIDFHLYGFTFSKIRLSSSFKDYVNRNTQSPPSSDRQKQELLIKLFFSQSLAQDMLLH